MLTVLFAVTILLICWRRPNIGPAGPKTAWKEKMVALSGVIETLVLFVFVIGGMFAGWFTPTEGGAFGAAGAIVISLIRRHLTWARFKAAVWDTLATSVMVLLLVGGAVVLGRFLTAAYLPTTLADWVTGSQRRPLLGPDGDHGGLHPRWHVHRCARLPHAERARVLPWPKRSTTTSSGSPSTSRSSPPSGPSPRRWASTCTSSKG